MLTSLTNRTLKTNIDPFHSPRLREQLGIPVNSATRENTGSNVTSTPEDQTPSRASTPPPLATSRTNSFVPINTDDQLLTEFLTDYLSRDGRLVLYILQINTNEVITGEIVTALYELFRTTYHIETVE